MPSSTPGRVILLLALILALGTFLRFHKLASIPGGLWRDEAYNGTDGLEALRTHDFKIYYPDNNGREGLFINIQALSIAAFGATPWALRIISATIGVLAILAVYLCAREMFSAGLFGFQDSDSEFIALLSAYFLAT